MDHLLQVSVRSVLLAAVAAVGLWRVKSVAVRHAVWMLMTASMLVQIAFSPVLPEIPLRVLSAPVPAAITITNMVVPDVAVARSLPDSWSWEQLAGAVYLCGLLFFSARFVVALRFAQRLARASEPAGDGAYQSLRIAAPLTIGNKVLLPMSWRDWDSAKLNAVLAHEQAHVRRCDWTIAAMARANRCVFWFNPLAWWLERQLARLAEQACDDAALAVVEDRELYARTLLDVARAIQVSGRVLAAPMAKEANVETRIDRILDETRRIPKALGRRGWMALALCTAPVVYVAAAAQLAPAQTGVMALPAPQSPQPPGLVMIAQTATPQAPPVLLQPAVVEQTQGTDPQIITERIERLTAAETRLSNIVAQRESATAAAKLAPQETQHQEEQMASFLSDQIESLKTEIRALRAQLDAPPPPGDSPIHATVRSVRLTTISIPLDPSGQFEISGRITSIDGKFVTSFDELADHRPSIEKQLSLKPGSYRLNIVMRNRKDGMNSTQEIGFEVE